MYKLPTFRPDLLSLLMADKKGEYYNSCMTLLNLCREGLAQVVDLDAAPKHERDAVDLLIRVHTSAATILERVWTSLHPAVDDPDQTPANDQTA